MASETLQLFRPRRRNTDLISGETEEKWLDRSNSAVKILGFGRQFKS
jgi:hypothetical protein